MKPYQINSNRLGPLIALMAAAFLLALAPQGALAGAASDNACNSGYSGGGDFTGNNGGTPCAAAPYYFGNGPRDVNNSCSVNQLWSCHPGGGNFALGDGSVRWVEYSGALMIVDASTYAGGETTLGRSSTSEPASLSPRYAAITAGFDRTASGGPLAI